MDYKQKNIKAKEKALDLFHRHTLEGLDEKLGSNALMFELRSFGLSCTKCGGYITYPILKFYYFEVTRVLCYDCQKLNSKI